MNNKINRVPLGLLDIFNVKQQGDYPPAYDEKVSVGFDATFLQLNQLAEYLFDVQPNNVGAVTQTAGSFTFATPTFVPDNETWLVLANRLTLEMIGAGATGVLPSLGYQTPAVTGINGFIPIAAELFRSTVTGTAAQQYFMVASQMHQVPSLIPPSSQLVYALMSDIVGVAGGAFRWRSMIRFVRIRL